MLFEVLDIVRDARLLEVRDDGGELERVAVHFGCLHASLAKTRIRWLDCAHHIHECAMSLNPGRRVVTW